MNRLFQALHGLSHACGVLPLFAAAIVIASARLAAVMPPMPAQAAERPREVNPPDFAVIDAVLAKRAPDLGLTLRRQLALAISEEALRAGFEPLLIIAVIDVESDFIDEAVSPKGARGLMQIMPTTLAFLARKGGLRLSADEVDRDPALRVRLGIRYLRELVDRFGDLDVALMAYNAGPTKIRRALRRRDLEPFRRYPELVRRDFHRFREGAALIEEGALAQAGR